LAESLVTQGIEERIRKQAANKQIMPPEITINSAARKTFLYNDATTCPISWMYILSIESLYLLLKPKV